MWYSYGPAVAGMVICVASGKGETEGPGCGSVIWHHQLRVIVQRMHNLGVNVIIAVEISKRLPGSWTVRPYAFLQCARPYFRVVV